MGIIQELKVPVGIFYGEEDQIINFDFLNSLEIPTIWRYIVQIIKDVGHIFFYESPADFNVNYESYLHTAFNN